MVASDSLVGKYVEVRTCQVYTGPCFANGEVGSAVIYFEHEALDEMVADLRDKGFQFDQEPTDMSYLWREAILRDPSGNKIKLYWAGVNRLQPPWRVERRD